MNAYGRDKSLTRLVGEYFESTGKTNRTKFTFHSFVRLDNKGREFGIKKLIKYFNNHRTDIKWAQIKCNISDEVIETLKVSPDYAPD